MGFFGKGKTPEPQPVSDFVEIARAAKLKKAQLPVQTVEDTTKIVGNVLSQLKGLKQQEGGGTPETNMLQNIMLDETTQVIIPLYLRKTDIFREALKGENGGELRKTLSLSEIDESMVKTLSGIDIQVQSGEDIITTQMYQRMNINENVGTLGDYILAPHKIFLQEVS